MPVAYRYDEMANRLLTRCEGAVTYAEVMEHFRNLTRDSRLRPNCDVLLDLSFIIGSPTGGQMSEVTATLEEMHDLVSFGHCAVVAAVDVAYGLARMFQGFAWPLFTGIRVFRTHADATAWLNEKPVD